MNEAFQAGFDLGAGKKKQKRAIPDNYKHGGRVKRTGVALVHKGELVVPAKRGGRGKVSTRKHTVVKA